MNILFDLLYITNTEHFGVKTYSLALIKSLCKYYTNLHIGVLCLESQKENIKSELNECHVYFLLADEKYAHMLHKAYKYVDKTDAWLREDSRLCDEIKKYDVCISPFANGPLADFSQVIKHIGVIHDLQGFKVEWENSKNFKTIKTIWRKIRKIRKLNAIISISGDTKRTVDRCTFRKSYLIYNSLTHIEDRMQRPADIPEDFEQFILDINSFFHYKNASTLLKAFALLKDDFPKLKLYFKGNHNPDYELLPPLADSLEVGDRVVFDRTDRSDEEITWLYKNASLFVSPSLMEGFGFTPVEAIVHKVPTIVSDIPTLREVTCGCAELFNPTSVEELSEKIKKILKNPLPAELLQQRSDFLKERYSDKVQVEKIMTLINEL